MKPVVECGLINQKTMHRPSIGAGTYGSTHGRLASGTYLELSGTQSAVDEQSDRLPGDASLT